MSSPNCVFQRDCLLQHDCGSAELRVVLTRDCCRIAGFKICQVQVSMCRSPLRSCMPWAVRLVTSLSALQHSRRGTRECDAATASHPHSHILCAVNCHSDIPEALLQNGAEGD